MTVALVFAFACGFYAIGESCFAIEQEDKYFSFAEMVWLSVHVYSTVGFGSVYPTCAAGHLVVLLEQYVALIFSSFIIALIVAKVLQPRPRVRFSSVALIGVDTDDGVTGTAGDGGRYLTFRIVRESYYELTNCRVTLLAAIRHQRGAGGTIRELSCVNPSCSPLNWWQVCHKVDESSPLFRRETDLWSIVRPALSYSPEPTRPPRGTALLSRASVWSSSCSTRRRWPRCACTSGTARATCASARGGAR